MVRGTKGQPVINPDLAEWMMGFPAGWCTELMARRPSLKALGNAVQPQVAAWAWQVLSLRLLADRKAS